MPAHHPAPELLVDYAAGSLREVQALLVASHLAFCPVCRREVSELEACGGALFDELPGEPVADSVLDAVMARLSEPPEPVAPEPAASEAPPADPLFALMPGPLGRAVAAGGAPVTWNRVVPGVHLSSWAIGAGSASACLLRMGPRARVPAHRHTDNEMLLVLKGGYSDENGHYLLGDVASYEPATPHHAVADPDGECLCLLVQDKPLVFTGVLGWLLNRGYRF